MCKPSVDEVGLLAYHAETGTEAKSYVPHYIIPLHSAKKKKTASAAMEITELCGVCIHGVGEGKHSANSWWRRGVENTRRVVVASLTTGIVDRFPTTIHLHQLAWNDHSRLSVLSSR